MDNSNERFEWVELLDPKSQRAMYVNLTTGECRWERPPDKDVKPMSSDQWWELFDVKAQRNYYYNSATRETVWQKPTVGDIIPLANLQLLQQHPHTSAIQPNDIGVVRRTSSKDTAVVGTGRRVLHRKLPTSVLESRSRVNQDYFGSAEVNLPVSYEKRHSHQQPTETVDFGSQRVRDWLRDAKCPTRGNEDAALSTLEAHDAVDSKSSGCFSDRPVRRLHQLHVPATVISPISSEFAGLPFTSHLVDSSGYVFDANGTNSKTNFDGLSCTQPNTSFCQAEPLCTPSFNRPDDPHSLMSLNAHVTSNLMRSGAEHRRSTAASVSTVSNGLSPKAFDEWNKYSPRSYPAEKFSTSMASASNRFPDGFVDVNQLQRRVTVPVTQSSVSHDRSSYSSLSVFEQNTTLRQRAFPRTNPTVSRPPTTSTNQGHRFHLATTLNRSVVPHPAQPLIPTEASAVGTSRQFANVASHFSTSDLRAPTTQVPSIVNSISYQSTQTDQKPLTDLCSPPLRLDVSAEITDFMSFTPFQKQEQISTEQPRLRTTVPAVGSLRSESPHPSSSSSSSRTSSETALTNTSSERSQELIDQEQSIYPNQPVSIADETVVAPFTTLTDVVVPNHILLSRSGAVHPGNVITIPSHSDILELDHPPIPPPRSASTLGPQRLHQDQLFVDDFHPVSSINQVNVMQPYVFTDSRQYLFYDSRFQCYFAAPVLTADMYPTTGMTAVSSLSRNDPMRAHVIPPNHRRLPPFHTHSRSTFVSGEQPAVYPVPSSEGFSSEVTSDCINTSAAETCSTTQLLGPACSSGPDLTNSFSTGTGPGGTGSPSTTTTWVSQYTAAWDMKSDGKQQSVPKPLVFGTDPVAPEAELIEVEAVVPKRSPSGGFIGPGEPSDSVWLSISDQKRAGQVMPRIPLYTLVHPGHPAFERFTAPFDWPKHLFKPDQDVSSLMSWTKSKFSKRLLTTTDSNLKKQVVDTFKIIQSFMGDRKARLSSPDYGSIIIHRALNSASLRDELFAQLCKQTTGNPNAKSLTNGWALLCVCLYYFPPNGKFRDPLKSYLTARAEAAITTTYTTNEFSGRTHTRLESCLETAAAIASGLAPLSSDLVVVPTLNGVLSSVGEKPGSVSNESGTNDSHLSQTCVTHSTPLCSLDLTLGTCDRPTAAHFARVALRWFTRSFNVGPRRFPDPPSVDEICHVKDFILKPCVFGSSLEEIMQIQSYQFPHLKLPWIQLFLTEELIRLGGACTEGILRVSPDLDMVTEIRCQLEKLFEVFRVVYGCDPETCSNNSDETSGVDRLRIVRSPPSGWSYSARSLELPTDTTSDTSYPGRSHSSASFPEISQLTGEYSWPLIPVPSSSVLPEYVLLTPASHWPRNLMDVMKHCAGEFSAHQVDAHLAAGLLKLWLRELAEPLIPAELQPLCLKTACEAEMYESQNIRSGDVEGTHADPIQTCCQLVRKIPSLKRRSLLHLIFLLQHLSKREHAAVSLMDPRNLATVIAPNLMRADTTDPRELLENIRPQTLFVRLLITHLDVELELSQLITDER
ncbi:hypothetical protein AHF37_02958 [Paragonimus kellicotti]|nr:hypothetical protein AHF37_02958 [Paragonimus kellicotti]